MQNTSSVSEPGRRDSEKLGATDMPLQDGALSVALTLLQK